jgi:hypothetical protein
MTAKIRTLPKPVVGHRRLSRMWLAVRLQGRRAGRRVDDNQRHPITAIGHRSPTVAGHRA